jgi:hypothetical protein
VFEAGDLLDAKTQTTFDAHSISTVHHFDVVRES